MLPVKAWTIHYADGSTFTSEQGSWAEAPPFGVHAVVYYHPDGQVTRQEVGDDVSVYEHVGLPEGSDAHAKMGLWTDGESYWRVHDAVTRAVTP